MISYRKRSFLLSLSTAFLVGTSAEGPGCLLRNGAPSAKPFPSLSQCYKNNQDSCCVSAHDATIEEEYKALLSGACLREYESLETFYCMGCAQDMYNFVQWYDPTTKTNCAVGGSNCEFKRFDAGSSTDWKDLRKHGKYGMLRVCDSFLNALFFSSDQCNVADNSSTACEITKFDNCGLIIDGTGVMPSSYFTDAEDKPDYMLFLEKVRPPYFSVADFDISLSHMSGQQSAETDAIYYEPWDADAHCFSSAYRNGVNTIAIMLITFFIAIFLKD